MYFMFHIQFGWLSLGDILCTFQENLKALQARNKFLEKQAKESEQKERQNLKKAGKNVEEVMLQKKRLYQFELDKK